MGCCIAVDESKEGRKKNGEKTKNRTDKKNIIKITEIIPDKKRKENKIDENKSKEIDKKFDLKFVRDALDKNNDYRKLHGVKPLDSDDYLNKMAFILAKQYLTEGTLENNNLKYKNHEELGMNVLSYGEKLDGKQLMDIWYEEIYKPYNFIEPDEIECSNFTQMIWKKSTNFGCGYYCLKVKEEKESRKIENQEKNKENQFSEKYYYVALYYPAGNQPGEFKSNVLKKNEHQNKPQIVSSPESKTKSQEKDKVKNNSSKEEQINAKYENYDKYNGKNISQKVNENDITFVEPDIKKED